ncbi:MAG TPA: peptidase M50 [Methanocorpusculum sp.]|nr:peptidase M50 [Methanocorpusculum sp.]HJJ54178.1 peptidase M50 [Methanocorpusculum sp.]
MSLLDKISPFERKDLLIAWLVLGVAFTLAINGGLTLVTNYDKITVEALLITFVISLVTVGLAFVLHELAHKFTAMKFGYWAEFRKSTQMLIIAVVVAAITGIVFAAPGATLINTAGREITKKENGIISIAGPMINLILIIPFLIIMIIGFLMSPTNNIVLMTLPGFLFYLGMIGFQVNAMIAFFNMLPFGPLDGKKILRWNPVIFGVVIVITLGLLYLALFMPTLILSLFI